MSIKEIYLGKEVRWDVVTESLLAQRTDTVCSLSFLGYLIYRLERIVRALVSLKTKFLAASCRYSNIPKK